MRHPAWMIQDVEKFFGDFSFMSGIYSSDNNEAYITNQSIFETTQKLALSLGFPNSKLHSLNIRLDFQARDQTGENNRTNVKECNLLSVTLYFTLDLNF